MVMYVNRIQIRAHEIYEVSNTSVRQPFMTSCLKYDNNTLSVTSSAIHTGKSTFIPI